METILKIGGLLSLISICIQDFKERRVFILLFLLAGISTSFLYYTHTNTIQFFMNIMINLGVILLIISTLLVYSNLKLKQPLFEVFGNGDLIFFIVFACSFPLSSFIILFVSSLIFSLIVFLFIKKNLDNNTIPLAGLQALFLGLVLTINWMSNLVNLYQ